MLKAVGLNPFKFVNWTSNMDFQISEIDNIFSVDFFKISNLSPDFMIGYINVFSCHEKNLSCRLKSRKSRQSGKIAALHIKWTFIFSQLVFDDE